MVDQKWHACSLNGDEGAFIILRVALQKNKGMCTQPCLHKCGMRSAKQLHSLSNWTWFTKPSFIQEHAVDGVGMRLSRLYHSLPIHLPVAAQCAPFSSGCLVEGALQASSALSLPEGEGEGGCPLDAQWGSMLRGPVREVL